MQWQLVKLDKGADTSDEARLSEGALGTYRSMGDAQQAAHEDAGVKRMAWESDPDDPPHSLRATPGGGVVYLVREV